MKEVLTTLLWQINDYERMLTGGYYEKEYVPGETWDDKVKLVRKKDKAPTRKLRKAPKRKRKIRHGRR